MIRCGQVLLVTAAVSSWVASRLRWVTVSAADGLGQPKTIVITGAMWSNALVPLAVALLAAAVAGLAVRGWSLRLVAVVLAVMSLALGYLGISLIVINDVGPRGADIAGVSVLDLVASDRHYFGAAMSVVAAVLSVIAAALFMRCAGVADHRTTRYQRESKHPERRSENLDVARLNNVAAKKKMPGRTSEAMSEAMSERMMWDAFDKGSDPTER